MTLSCTTLWKWYKKILFDLPKNFQTNFSFLGTSRWFADGARNLALQYQWGQVLESNQLHMAYEASNLTACPTWHGDATGIRTPVTGETVRHNSLYMMAPYAPCGAAVAEFYWPKFVCLIHIHLLCLLFMLKKSLATKPHIYNLLGISIYWFVCRW